LFPEAAVALSGAMEDTVEMLRFEVQFGADLGTAVLRDVVAKEQLAIASNMELGEQEAGDAGPFAV